MRFGSGISVETDTGAALRAALGRATAHLNDRPDLVFVFASPHHRAGLTAIAAAAADAGRVSLGCLAEAVIAGRREVEDGPAVVAWAGCLPEVLVAALRLGIARAPEGLAVTGWELPEDPAGVVLVVDPTSFPIVPFVDRLATQHPGLPVSGGMASGGLFVNGEVLSGGAVGIALAGPVRFRTLVSQGCRPVGRPFVVTAADGHTVRELGGRPALAALNQMLELLSPDDRQLAQRGLLLGVVVDEYRTEFRPADFLVRNLIGADPQSGALEVGERVAVGRTIQFQVRDPETAAQELETLLGELAGAVGRRQESLEQAGGRRQEPHGENGVLLFTCNGRGRRFFGVPDHDAGLVSERLRPEALAGFFAAGEIGPVAGVPFLHGYTASLVELDLP
ncbi:MAG: FIST signal transduction protein [Acidimicrobiia bacterium]